MSDNLSREQLEAASAQAGLKLGAEWRDALVEGSRGVLLARNAVATRKLAEAGTILLGKLATHEFAIGGPSFDLPWPPARNPWNTDHFTGGSSSGTGAAVAAGLVLGGTGSDTGGSIRGPAAYCGIAGI